jgi:hypothetical protein
MSEKVKNDVQQFSKKPILILLIPYLIILVTLSQKKLQEEF